VIAVATGGKVVGTYAGARLIGRKDHWTALSFGAGLNARGAMEIIIATVGTVSRRPLAGHVLDHRRDGDRDLADGALRPALGAGARYDPEEKEASGCEGGARGRGAWWLGIHRVLLPVRLQPDADTSTHRVEARIMEKLHRKNPLSITLLTVTSEGDRAEAQKFLARMKEFFPESEVVTKLMVSDRPPQDLILDESEKDYDLLVLGASQEQAEGGQVVFSRPVDHIVRTAPCPTMIVRGHDLPEGWSVRRILVPTNGSGPARNAAEMAFYLADPDEDDEVTVVNVIPEGELSSKQTLNVTEETRQRRRGIAHGIVTELKVLGESLGVVTHAEAILSETPEAGILATARSSSADLIVMGTGVRPGGDSLFLGPRVERILATAKCPIVVFNT
jgi:nucleotide-binding universal stress UspA family protein